MTASHESVLSDSDETVDANTAEEINSFLDTFFKLYPAATEKELSYYVYTEVDSQCDREIPRPRIQSGAVLTV